MRKPEKSTNNLAIYVFAAIDVLLAIFTFIMWMLIDGDSEFALIRSVSVLIAGCPLALFLSNKILITRGKQLAADNNLVVDSDGSLVNIGKTYLMVIEKSEDLAKGEPIVTDIFPAEALTSSGYSLINLEDEIVRIAGILESKSDHPFAKAIYQYIKELHPYEDDEDEELELTNIQASPGNGATAELNGQKIYAGNYNYISQYVFVHDELREKGEALSSMGKTPFYYATGKRILGIIAVADSIKEDSVEAIKELKNMGVHVVMLTGDNENTAKALGKQAGIDKVIAGLMPEHKKTMLELLEGYENALFSMNQKEKSLLDTVAKIRLSRQINKMMKENLFWMIGFNALCVFFASGVLYNLMECALEPLASLILMIFSGIIVVWNASRLKIFDIHDPSKDKRIKNPITDIKVHGIIDSDSIKS
jgi:Cu2+-exporting ATPase